MNYGVNVLPYFITQASKMRVKINKLPSYPESQRLESISVIGVGVGVMN